MIQTNLRFPLLILGLAAGLMAASCGEQGTGNTSDSSQHHKAGLDQSIPCPDGEVGWHFAAHEIDHNTEEYDRRAGDNAQVDVQPRRAIDIVSATCDGNADAAEVGKLRDACSGKQSCDYTASCSGSYTLTYVCGTGDVDSNGTQNEYSVTNSDADNSGQLTLHCEQPTDAPPAAQESTVCIPRQCHGRTRRDENMQCVPDPTKLETSVVAAIEKGPTPKYKTQTQHNLDTMFGGHEPSYPYIYPNMPYKFSMLFGFENNLVPEVSTFAVWVEDKYVNLDDKTKAVYAYRCTPFKVDVHRDDPHDLGKDLDGNWKPNTAVYRMDVTKTLSNDCFDTIKKDGTDTRINLGSLKDGAVRAGVSLSKFKQNYTYAKSTMRISYDMEGRSVWHKNAAGLTPEQLAKDAPECTPNPPSFFYDAQSDSYDLRGYYHQRDLGWSKDVNFVNDGFPRRVEVGTTDIKPRRELTIRTHASYNPSLPIDISWYAVNYDEGNPFNPFPKHKTEGAGWRTNEDADNWGPKNLRAVIYVYPKEDSYHSHQLEALNKLGELPLKDPIPGGKTDTVQIAITNRVKKLFSDPQSPAYMANDTQAYELFYCIESDNPTPRNHADQWHYALSGIRSHGFVNTAMDEAYWGLLKHPHRPNYSVYLESKEETDARPYDYPGHLRQYGWTWRGCRRSKVPLIVHLDRFVTPTEPVSKHSYDGMPAQNKTGDDKMSGTNDNDSQVTCNDATKTDCAQTRDGQNRTGGPGGHSTYDITTASRHKQGDSVSADLKGELFGMQLIDPSDPVSSNLHWPHGGDIAPLNITLEPDWDGLRTALQAAAQGNRLGLDWEEGRYGGAMGLGVGLGLKLRWQLGPVPVLVTFSVTVGVSVQFVANFYFDPGDDAYPCLDSTARCLEKIDTPATFADAKHDCAVKGGRLAELSSRDEANQVLSGQPDSDMWLGAQLAYRSPSVQCDTNFNSSLCTPDSKTQFRWVSNSAVFAKATGEDEPTINPQQLYGSPTTDLTTRYPAQAAVYMSSGGTLKTADVGAQKPYVCAFEPAAKETFFKWDMAVNLGIAAGFGVTGCTPDDSIGFCLGASFNVVAMSIAAVFSNTYHWLYHDGDSSAFGRRGNTEISIPWSLYIFQGAVNASVKFLWASVNWTIAAYDGIKVSTGKLLDVNMPVMEDF